MVKHVAGIFTGKSNMEYCLLNIITAMVRCICSCWYF